MTTQRAFVGLVIVNLALLTLQFADRLHAQGDPIAPVLRGRALELVDDKGRVRAEIKVLPAQPNFKMPDGTSGYPETVQLRLVDSKGGPRVKLGTTEDGSGLVLGGEGGAYVQILSRGGSPFVKILTKDGKEQVLKP
jgi:hypothetical protein